MIRYSILLLLTFMCLSSALASSQKWGKISKEELEMIRIPEDPEANVLILFHKGDIKISPRFRLEMKIHKRIKILTEAGKEYANIKIHYWHKDKIEKIKAVAYSPNGKKHKLDNDDIFEEKADNFKTKTFAIPGVEVGSVIEYRYDLYSDYIHMLEPWYFQAREFTRFSEIQVYLPPGFTYNTLNKYFTANNIQFCDKEVFNPLNLREKCRLCIWTGENIPGIKKEPYMTAFHDYYAKILFQLVAYKSPYVNLTFAKRWDQITESTWKYYEDLIHQNKGLKEFCTELTGTTTDPVKKAEIIYDFVRAEIQTGEENGLRRDYKKPHEVWQSKSGSTNEKNLLLLNLLYHAGIAAKPLLISTRQHGAIFPTWVNLQQFNRILVSLQINGQYHFLNSGVKCCPFGYLIPEYDVGTGLLFDGDDAQVINFKSRRCKNRIAIETNAVLSEQGNYTAKSKFNYTGIPGILEREQLLDSDPKKHVENMLKELNSEAVLDSFQYTNKEAISQKLALEICYHIPNYIQDAGTLIYFPVPLFGSLKQNPFVRDQRNFPIDYTFPVAELENVKIQIPASLKISEPPQKAQASMKNLNFNKIYFTGEEKIECQRNYSVSTKRFEAKNYKILKLIYDRIVSSDQDQIVLVQKSE